MLSFHPEQSDTKLHIHSLNLTQLRHIFFFPIWDILTLITIGGHRYFKALKRQRFKPFFQRLAFIAFKLVAFIAFQRFNIQRLKRYCFSGGRASGALVRQDVVDDKIVSLFVNNMLALKVPVLLTYKVTSYKLIPDFAYYFLCYKKYFKIIK